MKKESWLIILGVVLFLIDRLTKIILIKLNLGFINYNKNFGVAFGLFQGAKTLLITLSLVLLFVLFYFYVRANFKEKFFLIFIIVGLASNLVDRLLFGYVIDFIYLVDLVKMPAFNLADVFIIFGIFMLVILNITNMLRSEDKK